jgi:hypothetical protein
MGERTSLTSLTERPCHEDPRQTIQKIANDLRQPVLVGSLPSAKAIGCPGCPSPLLFKVPVFFALAVLFIFKHSVFCAVALPL